MIKHCGCVSYMGGSAGAAYQDARYGAGMRVHNPLKEGGYRCTVCEKVVGSIKKK